GDFLQLDGLRSALATSRESSFRRFRVGQWVADEASWLPAGAWGVCVEPGAIQDGAEGVRGGDGSWSQGCTAVVVTSVAQRPHLDVVGIWEAPEGAREWRVPILDVEETIRQACRRWRVREVVFDPFRWGRTMQVLEAEGLPVTEFPQTPARMT